MDNTKARFSSLHRARFNANYAAEVWQKQGFRNRLLLPADQHRFAPWISMQRDERQVRKHIANWHCATAAGDTQRIFSLVAEDAVFLASGQPPLRGRASFMDAFEEGLRHYRIESRADVCEVCVTGDFACCWARLSVTMTPYQQGLPMHRTGDALTVLQRQPGDTWIIIRDANMLVPEPAVTQAEFDLCGTSLPHHHSPLKDVRPGI